MLNLFSTQSQSKIRGILALAFLEIEGGATEEAAMEENELNEFVGVPVEAVLMNSGIVIRGVIKEIKDGYAKFSSFENLFVLVHGKRLSIKFMLAGSFDDLEALLRNLLFPCELFDKCRKLKVEAESQT